MMTASAALRFYLLGPLQIEQAGNKIPLPVASTTSSLLAYLILNHDRPISRDRLAGIFWPERPNDRARRALSNTLWQIRRSLEQTSGRLLAEKQTVAFTFCADDWLDTEAFEETIQRTNLAGAEPGPDGQLRQLNAAVELYRGDLVEGCYDDWALIERERLRELYLLALEQSIQLLKQTHNYGRALAYAQRLVAADPLRESAHRDLMRLYHLLGRPQAALEQFSTLRRLLSTELGADPTPATISLQREIRAASDEASPPYLPSPLPSSPLLHDLAHLPFVGRTNEREALLYALQTAVQGHGGMAIIDGQPGVGKSRLAAEAIADAQWRGMQIGLGKSQALATPAPYQAIRDAVSMLLTPLRISQLIELIEPPLMGAAARLFPSITEHLPSPVPMAPLDPRAEQRRISEGVTRCLIGLSSISPLLLVMEDLQWTDEATLAMLGHLTEQLPDSNLLVIITYRTAEARERPVVARALDTFNRNLPCLRLRLAPFGQSESEALLQRALGMGRGTPWVGELAQRLQRKTGGNVIFIVETIKSLLEEARLSPSPDGGWELSDDRSALPTPSSIQDLVRQRAARLSPSLRATLEMIAVLGDNANYSVLSHANQGRSTTLSQDLESLCQRGFLASSDTGYHFEHDVIRETIYAGIASDQLRKLHLRAGKALEEIAPQQVESLALHYDRGGAEDKALHFAVRSGEQALELYDFEAALGHFKRALEFVGDDQLARWNVLEQTEKALYIISEWEDHARVLEDMRRAADELGDPFRQGRVLFLTGRHEEESGDPQYAITLLEQALEFARTSEQHELAGRTLLALANAHWRMGNVAECQAAAEESQRIFIDIKDRDGERGAVNAQARLHLGLTGDYGRALESTQKNLDISRELGNPYAEATASANLAITYALLGKYDAAQRPLSQATTFITKIGDIYTEGALQVFRTVIQRGLGDLDLARQSAETALRLCRQGGNPNFEIQALGLLGEIALDQGHPQEALRWFREAADTAKAHSQPIDRAAQLSHMALACSRLGDHTDALELSGQALTMLGQEAPESDRLKDAVFERAQIVRAAHSRDAAAPFIKQAYALLETVAERISDTELRRSFLDNVAVNRAIQTAFKQGDLPTPFRRQKVRLPHIDAPTGRPLQSDEWVEIEWTLSSPEDDASSKGELRQSRLKRMLQETNDQAAAPTVSDLAQALGVSERTIKRDLAGLRAAGHTFRTRGGRST